MKHLYFIYDGKKFGELKEGDYKTIEADTRQEAYNEAQRRYGEWGDASEIDGDCEEED
jgi:hypothetical protein